MRFRRTIASVTAGAVTAGAVAAALFGSLDLTDDVLARGRRGGQMRLIDVDVGSFAGVALNAVIEFKFTQRPREDTVHHGIFRIREENSTHTGFTKQVPGHFETSGRIVRFYPRIATHLRDPDLADGSFYPVGSTRDDAEENAGLHPNTNYEIQVMGHPDPSPVRSRRGRKLRRTKTFTFTTAPISPRPFAYSIDTYQDAPPPGFLLSVPADKVASAFDQYAKHGGTVEVPNGIDIQLFGNRVPLAPNTIRQGDNVTLTLTERKGDPGARRPVQGTAFVEQNFDTATLVFQPRVALPDLGVYAMRVTKNVKDLTEQFDYRNNAERLRLRGVWEFLDTARQLSPNTPLEQLQDPPIDLIFDWPLTVAERSLLKRNVLELGDTYPDEIDPRVMVLFSTRDEPISTDSVVFEFEDNDGLLDDDLTTAAWDEEGFTDGAVSAIMTIAGGSGVDGDYEPAASETINVDAFPDGVINWRNLDIPPGVVVTLEGSRPAIIRALNVNIEGELRANGKPGDNASTGSYGTSQTGSQARKFGGDGGPGGGDGGDTATNFPTNSSGTRGIGGTGDVGVDLDGNLLGVDDGGRGGLGGRVGNGTAYNFGGGGGGGGAQLAGTNGAGATGPSNYTQWSGAGGAGGAGSTNFDLDPFGGGAGGGAGGNGVLRRAPATGSRPQAAAAAQAAACWSRRPTRSSSGRRASSRRAADAAVAAPTARAR